MVEFIPLEDKRLLDDLTETGRLRERREGGKERGERARERAREGASFDGLNLDTKKAMDTRQDGVKSYFDGTDFICCLEPGKHHLAIASLTKNL